MNSLKTRQQKDYGEAVASLMPRLTRARQEQVYEFVLFLSGRGRLEEESPELIEIDENLWDAQFAATDLHKLDALIAGVESDIATGQTKPMFDARGKLVES